MEMKMKSVFLLCIVTSFLIAHSQARHHGRDKDCKKRITEEQIQKLKDHFKKTLPADVYNKFEELGKELKALYEQKKQLKDIPDKEIEYKDIKCKLIAAWKKMDDYKNQFVSTKRWRDLFKEANN